ncbi:bifunctional phosphopantothenoylcysteine decarboxylase/phosphopantothenate--cysteine ligase CoaBC [Salinibacterium hongtaonis]|uniref:Coenzyme A biosynthesis bifunctional protein CoaBC n=1 Tax=Homoserinimonas hongtaonis TaxID=2079791 RepID=A0A2U1SYP1_9MICO|nr:bifunctional phosphopantothenoylcysteine decarboxylase/phosphopantothenate--cysteine ligase CoaBC [Salinibacterium hongtaonis]PWB96722.1 bifunctional phosphopantothenoylcysteine decarboxylase/phosphopantothenate--cysteine ligase CoaBC [Salinibacterium hongtaonis]
MPTSPAALTIVVGITGGIAAYKAVGVVRGLVLEGHDVHVIATEAALRFVGRPTLEAISRNPVNTDLYEGVAEVRHVAIGQSADVIVIAPATANTIAKLAAGIADDLLGNTVLASTAPIVIAPAMHTEMWQNPATVTNMATLRTRGFHVVGPAVGQLTGADSGPGRLADPEQIIEATLAAVKDQDLGGRSIVVTAGGTREPLDPVRFLGNRSSGKQGVALATAAAARGATVTLIAANLEVVPPASVTVVSVESARELRDAVMEAALTADTVIMAAAVADYRPSSVAEGKIKKETQGEELVLSLVKNPDILAEIASSKRPEQVIVGFAAETENDPEKLLELGRQKLARKGCDFLVLNTVGVGVVFATDLNTITVLNRAGHIVAEAAGSKVSVADRILDVLL